MVLGAALLAALLPAAAQAQFYQCVTYAREVTGVPIRGNAHTWWGQAEGRFERGSTPREGAVMAFARSRAMPLGHVAVVTRIVNEREILLDHANWSSRGRVERGVRAVDVSAAGDWSDVRVWYGRIGDLGLRSNPVSGFIYGDRPADRPVVIATRTMRGPLLGQDVVQLAMMGG